MTIGLKTVGALTLGTMMLTYGGCMRSPSRVYPPPVNATAAGEAAMQEYDTNKDGKVTGEELQKAPSLLSAIRNLDIDGDKAVTAQEVAKRIEVWQAKKHGQMIKMVNVKYQGRPLAGAIVVYEPEAFLGDNVMNTYNSTTDKRGMAVMRGIAPGLYKVKITKEGLDLPAKYNTQTTLGDEVAEDAKGAVGGAVFVLE